MARSAKFVILFMLVAGIAFSARDFAKLQIGSLFVAEAAFLAWLGLALIASPETPISQYFSRSKSLIVLFVWGVAWLVVDLGAALSSGGPIEYMRIAQHSLLFIYPILWVTVGQCARAHFKQRSDLLILASLVTTLPNLVGQGVTNLSLGPIMALPWIYFMSGEFRDRWKSNPDTILWLKAIGLTYLACFPFWRMWLGSVQRTSFLSFVFMVCVVPWVIRKTGKSAPHAFRSSALLLGIYVTGQSIMFTSALWSDRARQKAMASITMPAVHAQADQSPAVPPTNSSSVKVKSIPSWTSNRVITAIQHGEDQPFAGSTKGFQMRMRRFMWKTAIEDWMKRPLVGIGFIPELPSYIQPGIANTTRAMHGMPPIAGPHNSYLTVLARTGPFGIVLLGIFFFTVARKALRMLKTEPSLTNVLLVFIPVNGAIYSLFNSGFESPQNCLVMWMFIGILIGKVDAMSETGTKVSAIATSDKRSTVTAARETVLC